MNIQENIRRILKEETKSGKYISALEDLTEDFKEKDCLCDIKIFFDVEDNYYNVYLVFSQEELHDVFSGLHGIRSYIQKMRDEVKMELESFLPIPNIFVGYYTKPNCEWSPLNESKTLQESEEKTNKNVNLVKQIIYDFFDEVTSIEVSDYDDKPKLIVHLYSNSRAANIKSWFDEHISDEVMQMTGGHIVVCPYWTPDWDFRKKIVDIYIDTRVRRI